MLENWELCKYLQQPQQRPQIASRKGLSELHLQQISGWPVFTAVRCWYLNMRMKQWRFLNASSLGIRPTLMQVLQLEAGWGEPPTVKRVGQ